MITGKLMVSKNYGLSGSTARWVAVIALVSGYVLNVLTQLVIGQSDYSTIIGAVVQIIAIIFTVVIATKIHGNDLGE